VALKGIAGFHGSYLHQGSDIPSSLKSLIPILEVTDTTRSKTLVPLYTALLQNASLEFPNLITPERKCLLQATINATPKITSYFTSSHSWRTLIHNDFSPRNVCLRVNPDSSNSLLAYDWELSTIHVPQRDIAEFLCFTMPPNAPATAWSRMVEYHRAHVEVTSATASFVTSSMAGTGGILLAQALDSREWLHVFDLAVCEFLSTRMMMYALAHTFKSYAFFDRVIEAGCNYLTQRLAVSGELRRVLGISREAVLKARL
ncbi:hypothetical protein HDU76_005703, partial [Blyttiomyces sp. JEL0837]